MSLGRRHLLALALLRRDKQLALSLAQPARLGRAKLALLYLLLAVCGSFGLSCAVENLVRKPHEPVRSCLGLVLSTKIRLLSQRPPPPTLALVKCALRFLALVFGGEPAHVPPFCAWPFGLGQPPLCMQGREVQGGVCGAPWPRPQGRQYLPTPALCLPMSHTWDKSKTR